MKKFWLSIDPASFSAGIALWTPDGQYVASKVFRATQQETFRRYHTLNTMIWEWVAQIGGADALVVCCIVEQIPKLVTHNPALPFSASALLVNQRNVSDLKEQHMVAPQTWKWIARKMGAGLQPKGILALKEIGWLWKTPENDDEADAILIFLAHRLLSGQITYFSPTDARRMPRKTEP
jgi:hypothetical protein